VKRHGVAQRRGLTVAGQVMVLQLLAALAVIALAAGFGYADARGDVERSAGERALAIARSVADSPEIIRVIGTADPSVRLQPYAERVRLDTETDFVVIMTPDGIRYTHPNPDNIGEKFIGTIEPARQGRVHVEQYAGTLGSSMRAVVPVTDNGTVVALVSVGITIARLDAAVLRSLPALGLAIGIALVIGVVGAAGIGRRLRRQTHGLGPAELSRMYEYYDAVLHSIREGLVLLDARGRVRLANDEAVRLFGLPPDFAGRPIDTLGLPETLTESLRGADPVRDEVQLVADRLLVLNRQPTTIDGRALGFVVTVRDHTELQAIAAELDAVRGMADSLRAQSHEAANRLHTVVSLIEMGRADEAVEFATAELELAQRLTDRVVAAVDDPVVAALLLGKTEQASERGVELVINSADVVGDHRFQSRDLITMIGNLIDNAVDAAAGRVDGLRHVSVEIALQDDSLRIVVDDSGPGLSSAARLHAFDRGWSSKPSGTHGRGIGLALVVQTVRRLGGRLDLRRSDLGGAEFVIMVEPGHPAAIGDRR
jgi:two-component system CitB family sensor kinase